MISVGHYLKIMVLIMMMCVYTTGLKTFLFNLLSNINSHCFCVFE
jgi:hypothetical protein